VRWSQSSLPTQNASAVAALAARLRVTMMSAEVSANDRLACSIRSPRTSPTCHARTRGGGNETSESARAAGATIESGAEARPGSAARESVASARLESGTAASESVASARLESGTAASESVASERFKRPCAGTAFAHSVSTVTALANRSFPC